MRLKIRFIGIDFWSDFHKTDGTSFVKEFRSNICFIQKNLGFNLFIYRFCDKQER